MKNENEIGINKFTKENSGVFTIMGIFLIFVTISPNFLPNEDKTRIFSQYIWMGGIIILIFSLILLIYKIYTKKENSESLKIFLGAPLILITFPLILFFIMTIFNNENMLNFFLDIPNAVIPSISIIFGAIIVLLPKKISSIKWKRIIYCVIFILFLILIVFSNWRNNFWYNTNNLSMYGWFTYSVLITGILNIIYSVINWIKKLK